MPRSCFHSSGERRTARTFGASCFASVVLPEPGKPQMRIKRALLMSSGLTPRVRFGERLVLVFGETERGVASVTDHPRVRAAATPDLSVHPLLRPRKRDKGVDARHRHLTSRTRAEPDDPPAVALHTTQNR